MRSRKFKDKGVFHIQDMKDTGSNQSDSTSDGVGRMIERFNVVM